MQLDKYLSIRYKFGAPLIQDEEIKEMYLTDYSRTRKQSIREGRKTLRALDRLIPLLKLNGKITTVRLNCRDSGSGKRYSITLRNTITGSVLVFTPYLKTEVYRQRGSRTRYANYAYLERYEDKRWVKAFDHGDTLQLKELLEYISRDNRYVD